MNKKTKTWLIIASLLVVLGGFIFTFVLAANNWDFTKISSVRYETNTYEITEVFDNISIKTDTTDIIFKYHNKENCKIVFFEEEKIKHTATLNEKTLNIGETDTRKWFDFIHFFSFGTTKITVYLPKESYSLLDIETDTSDIKIPKNFSFEDIKIHGTTGDVLLKASVSGLSEIKLSIGDININSANLGELNAYTSTGDIIIKKSACDGEISVHVSTGNIDLTDVTSNSFKSSGSTGDMNLKNVLVKEKLFIERSTGDIKLIDSDADQLFIKTSTGDVTGTLLSEKIFIANAETGTVSVPKTISGGKCEISTSTGDIKLDIPDTPS